MNDEQLRLLIRAAIQKHMGAAEPVMHVHPGESRRDPAQPLSISFSQYPIPRADGDTMCVIEPAVQCNHCGFCKCHGH